MADADRQVQVIQSRGLQTVSNAQDARKIADSLVQGAIKSLQQPITIPKSKGVDTSDVESEVENAGDTRDIVNEIIEDETDRFGMAIEGQKTAIKKGGEASAEKVMADQARAQNESDIFDQFAKMVGVGVDPSSDMAVAAQRMRQLRPIAEAKLKEVQEMQSVGFLDNPLAWLVNQVQLPAKIADYQGDANIVNYLQTTIDNSIQTGQNASQFAAKGIPTITTSQAKAEADRLRALAEQNVALADESLAKTNVAFAVHRLAGDISIANATQNQTNLQLQNEHLKYTSMINEINLADKHSERLLKAATLIEKLEGTKGLDIILVNYDRTMGHPLGTTTRYTFEKFAEGQRQNIIAIGAGSVGADPFEGMINWYRSRPGPGASPETARFFNYLRDSAETISTSNDIQRLDEKQKPAAISKRLKEKIQEDLAASSKLGNLFYEMSPTQMIQSGAIPAESHLAKVLEPFTKQTGPIDTNIILEAINKAYPNPVEAGAVISDYYKRNIILRNSVMNTSLAGITLPDNYKYRKNMMLSPDPVGLGAGAKMTFDLTRAEDATKLILLKRAGEAAAKSFGITDAPDVGSLAPRKPRESSPTWKEITLRHKEYFNP